MKKHAKKWLAMALSLSVACMMLPAVGFAAGNVASVDGTEYPTVQQAVDNANGKTVVLLDSVTESITIAKGQTIKLDLGGYTLTNTAKQHTITNNGTLTIQGSGKVDNVDHGKGALVNNGEVTIAGGTLTRSQEKGTDAATSGGNSWYVVDNHSTITMTGGQIINTSGFSSLVRNIGATFNLENGTLQNTFIVLKNDDNGVFNMTGGKVVTTGSQGSALQNWGKATISGGTLSATGGGVALQALEWDKKYQSVTEVKAGATVDGDVLVRQDPDYNTGEIEFTVTGGTINGNVTAGAGAEVALEGGSVSGALGTIADSGKLVVSGGSYAQSPAKYLAADAAAAGIGKQGGSATYYVGTPAQIEQRVEKAAAGDAVEVLQGDLNVTLPDGVAVINSGSGEVIVNDQPVTGEGVVTHTHKAVKVEAKDATETEAGNIAYWYCEGCGKYFADEALTKEITKDDTVVPAKGQAAQQPTATPGVNPQTGDNSNASVWAAMLSLAAIGAAGTACAAYRKRKAQ